MWTDEHDRAFDTIKEKLSERPLLALYNPVEELEVHMDANKLGLVGILLTTRWKKKDDLEAIYHSFELEVLAVVEIIETFRIYLLGRKLKLVNDCSSMKITTIRDLVPRTGR